MRLSVGDHEKKSGAVMSKRLWSLLAVSAVFVFFGYASQAANAGVIWLDNGPQLS